MLAPVHRLKKDELLWLSNHRCKAHGHTYLSHWDCYQREHKDLQRVGFFDIEASHLTADIGILLSYCIKVGGEKEITGGQISLADINRAGLKGDEDRQVMRKLVKDIQKFDLLVTYYGKRFDVPFVRTRAMSMGIPFPLFGSIKHVDCYDLVKHRFRLLSNRLKNANKALLGKTDKTDIEWRIWRAAARGHVQALDYVVDHNRKDVTDLEKLWMGVRDFGRRHEVSI